MFSLMIVLALTSAGARAEDKAEDPIGKRPVAKAPDIRPADAKPAHASPFDTLCDDIGIAAKRYALPLDYFTRLIWRESRFQRFAVSPAGAQGVAQFMPKTAAGRGLADPFATHEAVLESAAYLDELRTTFGNLGLAAAAYNAGPGRLSIWIAGQGAMPQETLDYVIAITGYDVEAWNARQKPEMPEDKRFSCANFAELASRAPQPPAPSNSPTGKDWAIVLVGNPQRAMALSEYQMVKGRFFGILGAVQPSIVHRRISGLTVARYIVQIERDSRADANALCSRLLRAGGSCFVLANR